MIAKENKDIDIEASVGELVAKDYRTADVFKKFGIDFCCGGKKSLKSTCKQKGLLLADVESALAQIESLQEHHDYNAWDLDFLIDYIINVHHKYVLDSIPPLTEYSVKVARVHGNAHPEVLGIRNHFQNVANDLLSHMEKEEQVLFPYIHQMAIAKRDKKELAMPPFGTINNPIRMMELEHETAGDAFHKIKELSSNFNPPENACMTFKVLYSKLEEFERNLHEHIHLENNILFPKAILLESELLT